MYDSFIITGGWKGFADPSNRVTEYDIDGNRIEHPSMNVSRASHGCGYYMNQTSLVNSTFNSCQIHFSRK